MSEPSSDLEWEMSVLKPQACLGEIESRCDPGCLNIVKQLAQNVQWEDDGAGASVSVTLRSVNSKMPVGDIEKICARDGMMPASPAVFLSFVREMAVREEGCTQKHAFLREMGARPVLCLPSVRLTGKGLVRLLYYQQAVADVRKPVSLVHCEAGLDIAGSLYHVLMVKRF